MTEKVFGKKTNWVKGRKKTILTIIMGIKKRGMK